MRLTLETRKRVVAFVVEPPSEHAPEQHETQLDSMVELEAMTERSERAELDARRPIGFSAHGT